MNIKKLNFKTLAWAIVPALLIGFSACGDDDTPPPSTTTPSKTLNKTSLTNNKNWYNKGSGIQHYFKPDGKYFSGGTWRWINNSDTMEIIAAIGDQPQKYRFAWNTETELECERISGTGQGSGLFLMKTTEWQ